jgi:hypothetical protein
MNPLPRTVVVMLAVCLVGPAGVAAQPGEHRALALELARTLLDGPEREGIEQQVTMTMIHGVADRIQERLGRRLQAPEWQMLSRIVRTFVGDTLPASRTHEIAADVYVGHFDESELRELLAFQRSALGRKARRLAPVVARETAQAMDRAIAASPSLPALVDDLRRAFPVLGPAESP